MTDIRFTSDLVATPITVTAGDAMVVAAARVSTQGTQSLDSLEDKADEHKGFINFLMKNRHGTPFEHNSFIFFVSAPIFVFREFHRHRIAWSYNEESGRYKQLDPVFYIPDRDRKMCQVGKPGAYKYVPGTPEDHDFVEGELKAVCEAAYGAYERMLERGIAKEVARMCLPVNIYTSMYATCNARSLMSFLSLRQERTQREPHVHDGQVVWEGEAMWASTPMKEINVIADAMEAVFAQAMPITYATFVKNGYVAP